MRWMADTNYYDKTSLRWAPIQGGASPWERSRPAPTLITDYEYRVDDERFTEMTALNFDSNTDDYMWTTWTWSMGGSSRLHGDHGAEPELGVRQRRRDHRQRAAGPDRERPTAPGSSFSGSRQLRVLTTERARAERGRDRPGPAGATAPATWRMVVGRPPTTLYAASGAFAAS